MRMGKLMGSLKHGPQDLHQSARLITLHRVPGVRHDDHLLEARRDAGELGGVVVIDEERLGPADQHGRRAQFSRVLPQALLETLTLRKVS